METGYHKLCKSSTKRPLTANAAFSEVQKPTYVRSYLLFYNYSASRIERQQSC